ncbi:general transcription factor 3C polypeptide 5-like [Montipora foliosa]|uniref:general transcription factor 3C polypeptide 5-like n=1 Tax=Montipora foliosa TaxID=591990 RepID=UPI0035F1DC80
MAENTNQNDEEIIDPSSRVDNGRIAFSATKFVGINYPGYVKDESRMLHTLGGEDAVARTYSNSGRRLEMSFRPGDPHCHAVCADRYPTANLLLRVKQRKKKRRGDSSETSEVKYEQEILGIVGTTFKFQVMADFQYLAPDMPDFLAEVNDGDALNQDIPLHLPPPVFSRFDHPADYDYRPEPKTKKGVPTSKEDEEERLAGTRTRLRRPVNAIAVNFSMAEVPSEANSKAVEIANKIKDGLVEVISKLFANRPVWSRAALQCHIQSASQERFKQLLAAVSYYWLNGPWRALWTRIGYDPRKHPGAKIYQMLDFRVGSRKATKNLSIKAKRDLNTYTLPNLIGRATLKGSLVKEAVMISSDAKLDQDKQNPDLPYVFTPNKMPVQKQLFYQLCDLHDPEIQRLISVNDGQENYCHERDGWCVPGTSDKIREILYQRTSALAERLRKQAEERAEESSSQSPTPLTEPDLWGGHEGVQSFLEMLEQDDDIEAYDIFDDFPEGDD